MIAKITNRANISGIVDYAYDADKKAAEIIDSNGVFTATKSRIIDSFKLQLKVTDEQGKVHQLSTPFKHVSIAFSPKDKEIFEGKKGNSFMAALVREWMKEMDIDPEDTAYIVARHNDKEHPHCHLVFCRINNHGRIISDRYERKRSGKACKKIKEKHKLTFGNPKKNEVNQERLRKYEANKIAIKSGVLDAFSKSRDWVGFIHKLADHGITMRFSYCQQGRFIRGISFEKNGFKISGSKLGNHGKFTYSSLATRFGWFNERYGLDNMVRPLHKLDIKPGITLINGAGLTTFVKSNSNAVMRQRQTPYVPSGKPRDWEIDQGHGMDWVDDKISHGFKM